MSTNPEENINYRDTFHSSKVTLDYDKQTALQQWQTSTSLYHADRDRLTQKRPLPLDAEYQDIQHQRFVTPNSQGYRYYNEYYGLNPSIKRVYDGRVAHSTQVKAKPIIQQQPDQKPADPIADKVKEAINTAISAATHRLIPAASALDDVSNRSLFTSGGGSYESLLRKSGVPKSSKKRVGASASLYTDRRKPCNCTKSQCLKLYCECFAAGEFCLDCNCRDCYNNLEHEVERRGAIRLSLERNPTAFKPKIGVGAMPGRSIVEYNAMERLHQKGCHCKRSNCLKNYCECYEAKVPCTDRCKCQGCQNTEMDRQRINEKQGSAVSGVAELATIAWADALESGAVGSDPSISRTDAPRGGTSNNHHEVADEKERNEEEAKETEATLNPKCLPATYLDKGVINAIAMCLMASAHELENSESISGLPKPDREERLQSCVLKDFSRCLIQIIESCQTTPTNGNVFPVDFGQ